MPPSPAAPSSDNSASNDGGGIYNNIGGTGTIKNSIVANSPSGGNCSGFAGLASNGHNLSSDGTCAFFAAGDKNNTNPLLGPLAFNGGPTPTHALLNGSPAADAGVVPCPPPATDQRGVSRPQGLRCDIGAYEADDSDGDGVADPLDTDDDNDGFLDAIDPCRTQPEDYDGFQDTDGCPDPDNDSDGVCDAGQTSVSCTGSDTGKTASTAAGTPLRPSPATAATSPRTSTPSRTATAAPSPTTITTASPTSATTAPAPTPSRRRRHARLPRRHRP